MSINHNLEILTDKQKSDLELAKTLCNNINYLKPSHVNKINLTYNGEKFYPVTVSNMKVLCLSKSPSIAK